MRKQFRLPLTGSLASRVSAVNAADSTSGYVGIGIVGLMIVGKPSQPTDKDQRFLNCFTQTTADGKKYRVKRSGFSTLNTPASGQKGYAIIVWTGSGTGTDVITAFGETNSTIYNGTVSLGAITGRCTGLSETFVTTTPTICATSTDSTGWYYDSGVGVMTKIADADFPGNAGYTLAGTFVHLDGYAIIATTDGKLWASDLNSVTPWTATSFDSANAYPDRGVAAVRHRDTVILFGSDSMQVFQNAGRTPFPLVKVDSLTARVGAVSMDAITQISDVTFWAGSTPQGGLSIFQFDGAINRISTPEVDALLVLAGASNVTLSAIRTFGRSFVLVSAASETYAYCIEEKEWGPWSTTTPLWYKTCGVSMGSSMLTYSVSNKTTSGKVYTQNPGSMVFTDDGVAYTARMQLTPTDFGTMNKKFWKEVTVVGDVETSASALTLACSDDNYQSFTTLATLDLSEQRPRATRLGASRRRAWAYRLSISRAGSTCPSPDTNCSTARCAAVRS